MSLRSISFTAAARNDFRAIQRYSRRMWGVEFRDKYADTILASLERLVQFPELGQRPLHSLGETRRLVVGEHAIYYTVRDETIVVLRILHKRQSDLDALADD